MNYLFCSTSSIQIILRQIKQTKEIQLTVSSKWNENTEINMLHNHGDTTKLQAALQVPD